MYVGRKFLEKSNHKQAVWLVTIIFESASLC